MPEVQIEGLTQKMGMNRKTAHRYNKEFEGNYGHVRDIIVLEASWLGHYEPFTTRNICSFVGNMMLGRKQDDMVQKYGLQAFEVRVLEPVRTICEKIMSLVRFSYGEYPVGDLRNKIRHTYDLHQLLQEKQFADFIESPAFDAMLLKVATDDVASFRNNNRWLIHHPQDALMFKDLDNIWKELSTVYNGEFKNLVYGRLPDSSAVLTTMKKIKERLASIKWTIEIPEK